MAASHRKLRLSATGCRLYFNTGNADDAFNSLTCQGGTRRRRTMQMLNARQENLEARCMAGCDKQHHRPDARR